jgi:hypothetical protein
VILAGAAPLQAGEDHVDAELEGGVAVEPGETGGEMGDGGLVLVVAAPPLVRRALGPAFG